MLDENMEHKYEMVGKKIDLSLWGGANLPCDYYILEKMCAVTVFYHLHLLMLVSPNLRTVFKTAQTLDDAGFGISTTLASTLQASPICDLRISTWVETGY
ncbi:uncharacterized protein ARMOST_02301 [Armillaria ostoyae]|uniref:Uncharacterized protein n=1 Tax=Armillaria ostoyae TaxID=47428 RepID=A0A284QRB9_ARMOS|nr:uncharacterized protein ARMOST_02301 [Armillaria ostoyae]